MPNEEILKYIKDCLSQNYTKEQIKQSLIQVGWGNSQIDEALLSVQTVQSTPINVSPQPQEARAVNSGYIPEKIEAQKVPPKSILPLAIMAGTAVIIVGIGVTLWILTKDSTTPSQLAIEQTIPVKATTTTDQNSQVLATTSSQAQLSEIDKYGVDLYALKQGETTIDLDSKEKLLVLMEKGEAFLGSVFCKDSSVKECADSKVVLNYLKINCLVLQKNEEIGICLVAATLSAETNRQPSNVNSLKNTIESTNALDLSTEKERDAKRFSDINQIQHALDLYYSKKHGYPVYLEELVNEKFLPEELTDPSVPVGYPADYLYLSYSKYDPIQKTGTECNSSPCAHYVLGAAFEQKDYKVPGMTAGEVPGCFSKQLGRFCYSVAK